MTRDGLNFYKLGLQRPTHDEGIPKNPNMSLELKKALSNDKRAQENFDKLSPSKQKMLYRWLLSAKLPETREKRVETILKSTHSGNQKIM